MGLAQAELGAGEPARGAAVPVLGNVALPDLGIVARRLARRAAPERLGFRQIWATSVILPLVGLLVVGWLNWDAVVARERHELRHDTALLQEEILRTFELQETVLKAVDSGIVDLGWPAIRHAASVRSLLRRIAATSPFIQTVSLISPDGHIAAEGGAAESGAVESGPVEPPSWMDLSGRDYVAAFPPGTSRRVSFVGLPQASVVDGVTRFTVARPRLSASGVADGGVIAIAVAPATLESLFAAQADPNRASGQSRVFVLARTDGAILARYPGAIQSDVLHAMPPQREVAEDDVPAPASADTEAAAPHLASSGSFFSGVRIKAAQRVGDYPVVLSVALDRSRLSEAWLSAMTFPVIGAVATAALLLLSLTRARLRVTMERDRMLLQTAASEAARSAAVAHSALEARLRQTEKAAALGQLAAGVAHDFSNVLQMIAANVDALQRMHSSTAEVARHATQIQHAAERGTALANRMLDFAHRDESANENATIHYSFAPSLALRDAVAAMRQILGISHRLRLVLPEMTLPPARGRRAEFEAVVINLVTNARDAMPEGGEIVIEALISTPPGALQKQAPDRYLRVQVRDTGKGMTPEVLARAGEAFFTTKPNGAGTGLGLAMARGFTQRAGGMLELSSGPGLGTTVTAWVAAA